MARTWCHLHIGRARRGLRDVVSVKVGNEPTHYRREILLWDVDFVVRPAGLRKFRETGQKNVHAFVVGKLNHLDAQEKLDLIYPGRQPWRFAKYNPALNESFIDAETGESIREARFACLIGKDVLYIS